MRLHVIVQNVVAITECCVISDEDDLNTMARGIIAQRPIPRN